jgi:hypothetical protein
MKFDDRAVGISFTKTALRCILADGRKIFVPLEWFPRLRNSSETERNEWRFIGNGIGIRWPKLDEDILVRTLMRGYENAVYSYRTLYKFDKNGRSVNANN